MIYLDHNATTRPTPEVVAGVVRMLEQRWENPSSAHRAGQAVRREVELARERLARLVGATPNEVVFTATATESIDLAIRGTLNASSGAGGSTEARPLIITTPIEHEAVRMLCDDLDAHHQAEVRLLAVDHLGLIDPDELNTLLHEHAQRTALVTVQWANNETGIVQPMQRITQVCAAHNTRLHTDATQLLGKRPVDCAGIDLLTLAGHKFHAPKGVGALIVRKGTTLARQTHGVQELERRGGTENTAGIVGLGIAADQAREWVGDPANIERLDAMRDAFEQRLLDAMPGAASHIAGADRLPNTISIGVPGADAEALVLALSERGVCVSAGAACASGSMEPSPVLRATHIPHDLAGGTIRISLSRFTKQSELDEAFPHIVDCAAFARAD